MSPAEILATGQSRNSSQQKVRVTLTNGLGARSSIDQTFWTHEKTPGVAAHELIGSLYLKDGDTVEVSFLGEVS